MHFAVYGFPRRQLLGHSCIEATPPVVRNVATAEESSRQETQAGREGEEATPMNHLDLPIGRCL
jgi:hypothetical protein